MVEPGGGHHPGGVPLQLAHGPRHQIAHAVDEPDGEGGAPLQRHLGGLLRHELGLRRHDGAAGAALGQLIPGPLPAVDVVDVGDDLGLHEPLDEGGLPGAHRAHDADVDVPGGPGGDALIDGCICHSIPSLSALPADAVSYVPGRPSMPPGTAWPEKNKRLVQDAQFLTPLFDSVLRNSHFTIITLAW